MLEPLSVVHTFDPNVRATPDARRIKRLLAASADLDQPNFGFSVEEVEELAPLMRCHKDEWSAAAANLNDEELVRLVRLLTLAEALPGWQARERSPVIVLMAELRARNAAPAELGPWIRSSSENRFLPWGSLLDRVSPGRA